MYCVKCKKTTDTSNEQLTTTKNSSVYMGLLAQPFYPIFPHFSKLGPLFKSS